MAKDRIQDTFDYLQARALANDLPQVLPRDVDAFEDLVNQRNAAITGAALSLNWSWYNTRPSESLRHAIRAYLLASICNGDITTAGAGAEAILVKQRTAAWLHAETAQRLRQALGLADPMNLQAMRYRLQAAGHGTQRAQAVCKAQDFPPEQLLDVINQAHKLAVVVIDMQSDGDVGQHRYYGHRTVIEHQQAVLQQAAALKLIVYDIVIDAAGAAEWGNAYRLGDLSSKQRQAIVERQRRGSYAEAARVQTVGVLRNLYHGSQLRHIPKPTHPTFVGTLFAEHLADDGIEAVVVMGYDANQCVKATVFGVPSVTRDEALREPTGAEVAEVMRLNPALTVQQAQRQAAPTRQVTDPYVPGLLDLGLRVYTSRAILASSYAPLDPEWAALSGR